MKISDILKGDIADFNTNGITLVTHSGPFHSDDVLATAILELLFEKRGINNFKVVRNSFPQKEGWNDDTPYMLIYDIGLGCYDHHQIGDDAKHCWRLDDDGEIRKFAAVGLLWAGIGPFMFPKYYMEIYNSLIRPVDDHDNGNGQNPLSKLISCFNGELNDSDKNFFEAVRAVKEMVSKMFHSYEEKDKDYQLIEFALYMGDDEDYQVLPQALVTSKFHPAGTAYCRDNNIPFYVYPSARGGWCFLTIGVTVEDQQKHLVDIPDDVRNWEGVTFLHPSCFLGSAVTRERAIEVVTSICNNQ